MRGATTAYWVYGPEDAETTVIAVHGFRGEHHGLEPVLAYLPEVRVVAPDLPGFGESAPRSAVMCVPARPAPAGGSGPVEQDGDEQQRVARGRQRVRLVVLKIEHRSRRHRLRPA